MRTRNHITGKLQRAVGLAVYAPLAAISILSAPALAQPTTLLQELTQFRTEAIAVGKDCSYGALADFAEKTYETDKRYIDMAINVRQTLSPASKRDQHAIFRSYYDAAQEMRLYADEHAVRPCDPDNLLRRIRLHRGFCDNRDFPPDGRPQLAAEMKRLSDKIDRIARMRLRERNAVQRLGKNSRFPLASVQSGLDDAVAARAKVAKIDLTCAPRPTKTGDATGQLAQPEARNISFQEQMCSLNSELCDDWTPLIGRWTNPRFGGVIEFVRVGDEARAFVVTSSERMEQQGYYSGQTIIHGLRDPGSGGTWSFTAGEGEALSARHPDREPGEVFGQDEWIPNARVYVETDKPGILNLPANLEGRISDYDEWEKMGSATRTL